MSTTPVPAPRRKSNALWWILGGIGLLVVLLIISGLMLAGLIVKNVRVQKAGQQVEISTPAGQITINKPATRSVGLPIYPGATLIESGGNVELATPQNERVGLLILHYRASDSQDKVDAWYRAHLGPEFERDESGSKHGSIKVHGANVGSSGVAYVSDKDDLVRFVAISQKDGGVEITIGRIGKQEPL